MIIYSDLIFIEQTKSTKKKYYTNITNAGALLKYI